MPFEIAPKLVWRECFVAAGALAGPEEEERRPFCWERESSRRYSEGCLWWDVFVSPSFMRRKSRSWSGGRAFEVTACMSDDVEGREAG